jgi:ApaG protein
MSQMQTSETKRECVGSDRCTGGIRIVVRPKYEVEQSDPSSRQWIFSYRIQVSNEGTEAAQLLTRRWEIVDAHGERETVAGPGVVGKTPRLQPGESFEYSSYCPLGTNWGTMEGVYAFKTDEGRQFDAEVGRFILVGPAAKSR